jgi:hypothetical protein
MFQIKVVNKIKTQILCSVTIFQKSCRLWDNVEKYRVIRNDCRGFNNLSYTIHLREGYVVAPMGQEILKVFFYDVRCAVVMHFSALSAAFTAAMDRARDRWSDATSLANSRCNPMSFLSMGLRQGSGLCSSTSRKYPGTEGTIRTAIETITAGMLQRKNSTIVLMFVESQRVHI